MSKRHLAALQCGFVRPGKSPATRRQAKCYGSVVGARCARSPGDAARFRIYKRSGKMPLLPRRQNFKNPLRPRQERRIPLSILSKVPGRNFRLRMTARRTQLLQMAVIAGDDDHRLEWVDSFQ